MSRAPKPPAKASPPSVADEYVTFIQHRIPGLADGTYELTVSQSVTDTAGKAIAGDGLERSYRFAVQGDRFSIRNPAATVSSVFPANNATGEFDTVFAHAVFNLPAFPWSRYPTTTESAALKALSSGEDVEADVPTWLAVLILDDDDLAPYPKSAYPNLSLDPVTAQVRDLFPQAALPPKSRKSTLGTSYSYFDGATDTNGLELGESLDDLIQHIDLPMSLFVGIAPTVEDLKLTAHVREVSIENKPLLAGVAQPEDPIGTFAIVVGTRLPQANRRTRAYLVSLEALQRFLPSDDDGTTPTGPNVDMTRSIRLAVLQAWTFFSTGTSATFTDRLMALNTIKAGSTPVTGLRLTAEKASPLVQNALAMGYVPMNHALRDGGNTVSWYRGPLAPTTTVWGEIKLPVSSPDQMTVFDPTTGLLDSSLAAAWTIGRLVALQDKTFSASLYTWKKGLTRQVVDAAEQEIIGDIFSSLFAAAPTPAALLGAKPAPGPELLHRAIGLFAALSPAARRSPDEPPPAGSHPEEDK
ncbi:hypothetical protein [Mesorhizobium sp. CN2-181]|uniref:hypothetical protein n=1 Tax=Mesorhizobium yinganensis TaxID=3157707 RepID=UPI0032B7F845